MAVTDILEIRVLPPLAIGRFGSSPEPMDNYDVEAAGASGYRQLVPAATLMVDRVSGEVTALTVPAAVRFRDASKRIRPVAPFLELWARFTADGMLEPLTLTHLTDLGLTPAQVQWTVRAGNFKAARRTGQAGDRVTAAAGPFGDFAVHFLDGTGANIKPGKAIRFGDVQYLKPTAAFPEIRLRFTPATGKVFGPTAGDPNVSSDAYNAATGGWDEHNDTLPLPGRPPITVPRSTYARVMSGPISDRSLGYLDDACDAIIEVALAINGRTLTSFARVSSGPPGFAPDSFHVRTLADDLEQAALGPTAAGPVTADEIRDILRRALETMRLLNTDFWNVAYSDGAFAPPQAAWANAASRHQRVLSSLDGLDAAPGTPARFAAVATLQLARSFLREYDQVGNFTPAGRRKMPPFTRGSDGSDFALTRRQLSKLDIAIAQFGQPAPGGATPEQAMLTLITDLSYGAGSHMAIAVPSGGTLNDLFANPPALLAYLRANKAKGTVAGPSAGKDLVKPGDPDNSAFVELISRSTHPMNSFYLSYSQGAKNGIQIVREWIASLP
jgi:hypothetical protein